MATSLLSGAAFGAALVAAGVYKPSVIISQVKFENHHMIQAFLAATASSTLAVAILDRLNYVHIKPRSSSPLGFFSRYDGNIIGGSVLGIGLALSGACPGTVLVQAAVGIRSGLYALDGAILAGIAWTGFLGPIIEARKRDNADEPGSPTTVYEAAAVRPSTALFGLEAGFAAIIVATVAFTAASPFHPLVPPVAGGLLIGAAQLFSLLVRRSVVGVSTVYEDVGTLFWWLTRGAPSNGPKKGPVGSYSHLLFSAGIMASAYGLSRAMPEVAVGADAGIPPALATIGGALIMLGARTAGGCTSGHGISGVSLMSTSSFLTIASMFGAAALVAPYVN